MSCWKCAITVIFSLIFPPILLDDKAQVWRRNCTIAQVFVIFSLVLQFCYNHFTEKWRNLYKKSVISELNSIFKSLNSFMTEIPIKKKSPTIKTMFSYLGRKKHKFVFLFHLIHWQSHLGQQIKAFFTE